MSKEILSVKELRDSFNRVNTFYNDTISHALPLEIGHEAIELIEGTEGVEKYEHAQLLALVVAQDSTKMFIPNINAPGVLENYQTELNKYSAYLAEKSGLSIAELYQSFVNLGGDHRAGLDVAVNMVYGDAGEVTLVTAPYIPVSEPAITGLDDVESKLVDSKYKVSDLSTVIPTVEGPATAVITKTDETEIVKGESDLIVGVQPSEKGPENVAVKETDTHIEINVDKFPDVEDDASFDEEETEPEFEPTFEVSAKVDTDDVKEEETPVVELKTETVKVETEEVKTDVLISREDPEHIVIQKPDTDLGIETIKGYTIAKGQKTKLTNFLKSEDMEYLLEDIVAGDDLELETELAEKVKEFLKF